MTTASLAPSSLTTVCKVVADIFECPQDSLSGTTRLLQDLPCESIDLLEIATRLSQALRREVDDDALFLRSLRSRLVEAQSVDPHVDPTAVLTRDFPWLGEARVAEIVAKDLASSAPFVRLQDMAAYLDWLARD